MSQLDDIRIPVDFRFLDFSFNLCQSSCLLHIHNSLIRLDCHTITPLVHNSLMGFVHNSLMRLVYLVKSLLLHLKLLRFYHWVLLNHTCDWEAWMLDLVSKRWCSM